MSDVFDELDDYVWRSRDVPISTLFSRMMGKSSNLPVEWSGRSIGHLLTKNPSVPSFAPCARDAVSIMFEEFPGPLSFNLKFGANLPL